MGHVGGWPAANSLPTRTRVTPGTRAKYSSWTGVTPSPGPAWDGKDYLLLLAMRRRRRCPRNRRSRCSGAAWWTPGGAYIEHARVAEVTGELLPAQPGLLPGLVVVVVVVAPRRLTMSARHYHYYYYFRVSTNDGCKEWTIDRDCCTTRRSHRATGAGCSLN